MVFAYCTCASQSAMGGGRVVFAFSASLTTKSALLAMLLCYKQWGACIPCVLRSHARRHDRLTCVRVSRRHKIFRDTMN